MLHVCAVLKYLCWRLSDNVNTQLLGKILEFSEKLFPMMKEKDIKLHVEEASIFFPFLIEKAMGQNNEKFRERVKEILDVCCALYPSSKMFSFCMQGASQTKNAKVKTECINVH